MGTISPSQAADGTTGVNAASINGPINTIANEFNGNIDNANIKSGAAIATAKLATDAGIVTGMLANNAITSTKLVGVDKSNLTTDSNPYKFEAYKSSVSQTINTGSDTLIVFDVEAFDTNSNFTSNTYTVPVTGFYTFAASLGYNAVGSGTRLFINLYKNGSAVKRGDDRSTAAQSGTAFFAIPVISLTAGDTIDVRGTPVGANTVIVTGQVQTWFCGALVSRT